MDAKNSEYGYGWYVLCCGYEHVDARNASEGGGLAPGM